MKKYVMPTNLLISLIYVSAIFGIIPCLLVSGFALIHQQNDEAKVPVIVSICVIVGLTIFNNYLVLPCVKLINTSSAVEAAADIVFWDNIIQGIAFAILALVGFLNKKSSTDAAIEE